MVRLQKLRQPTTLFPKQLRERHQRSSLASTPPLTSMIYPLSQTSSLKTASTRISSSHLLLKQPIRVSERHQAGRINKSLQFVIDDISTEDSSAVGISTEWKGKNFPFSKGCSFYRLEVIDGKRQIVYGRDCVEPAIKPGETVLAAIKGVTWLLQKFPQLADQF
ncbi:unnamed protein product [Arabidopsis halleri]